MHENRNFVLPVDILTVLCTPCFLEPQHKYTEKLQISTQRLLIWTPTLACFALFCYAVANTETLTDTTTYYE